MKMDRKKGERKVFEPMHTTNKKKEMQKKHIIDPTRESYRKYFWRRGKKTENSCQSFLFCLNKYWKKLLNLKKGWCWCTQQQQKNHAHKLNDIICFSLWSPQFVRALNIYCLQCNLKTVLAVHFNEFALVYIMCVHTLKKKSQKHWLDRFELQIDKKKTVFVKNLAEKKGA